MVSNGNLPFIMYLSLFSLVLIIFRFIMQNRWYHRYFIPHISQIPKYHYIVELHSCTKYHIPFHTTITFFNKRLHKPTSSLHKPTLQHNANLHKPNQQHSHHQKHHHLVEEWNPSPLAHLNQLSLSIPQLILSIPQVDMKLIHLSLIPLIWQFNIHPHKVITISCRIQVVRATKEPASWVVHCP